MGGRGSGKTRAGAEWIADGIRNGTMNRVALIAATGALVWAGIHFWLAARTSVRDQDSAAL